MRISKASVALLFTTLLTLVALQCVTGQQWSPPANKTLWASRTIYQILTDRLDKGDGDYSACQNFNRYCGGTWKGITKMLPYIKDMGFDAIWFSPIMEQTGGRDWSNPDGYHGYWPRNFEALNPQFGTEEDLMTMIDTMHSMGMWAMLDVVPNHVGYGSLSDVAVLNDPSYFHSCSGCIAPDCAYDEGNDWQVRRCRLSSLPDLDQDHPVVASYLLKNLNDTYAKYKIDGYRVDAAKHTEVAWLNDLRTNLSIFTIGEYATGMENIEWKLKAGALDSTLNFPLYDGILGAFVRYDLGALNYSLHLIDKAFGPKSNLSISHLLGNFVENHDGARFLCRNEDIRMYENAHAAMLFLPGIPIVYYGAELGMRGQRDALWPLRSEAKTLVNKPQEKDVTDHEMYKVIQRLISTRKARGIWAQNFTRLNVSGPYNGSLFAFSRGDNVVVVLNSLRDPPPPNTTVTITGLTATPRILTNVLFPVKRDGRLDGSTTLTILPDGTASLVLSRDRWPQVFALAGADLDLRSSIEPFTPYVNSKTMIAHAEAALISFWVVGFVAALVVGGFMYGLHWRLCPLKEVPSDSTGGKPAEHLDHAQKTTATAPKQGGQPESPSSSSAIAITIGPNGSRTVSTDTDPEGQETQWYSSRVKRTATTTTGECDSTPVVSGSSKATSSVGGISSLTLQSPFVSGGATQAASAVSGVHGDGMVQQQSTVQRIAGEAPAAAEATASATVTLVAKSNNPMEQTAKAHGEETPRASLVDAEGVSDAMAAATAAVDQCSGSTQRAAAVAPIVTPRYDSSPLNSPVPHHASQGHPARPTLQQLMASNALMQSLRVQIQPQEEADNTGLLSPGGRSQVYLSQGGLVSPAVGRSPTIPQGGPAMPLLHSLLSSPPALVGYGPSLASVQELNQEGTDNAAIPLPNPLVAQTSVASVIATPGAPSNKQHVTKVVIPDENMILHVAMEYSIPHLADKGFGDGGHFMFGGLGKVVHMFLIGWPGPVGLCCPLYRKAYNDPDNDTVPSFLPPDTEPTLAFSVTVAKRYEPVEVFTVQEGNVTYFFVQAAIFKHRLKEDIYTFEEEEEMLRWISIMNQSVAAIISTFNFRRVQFHDWHGTMSLLYLPANVLPEVLLILHNAHYNGTFPVYDTRRKLHVYGMFNLDRSLFSGYLEYKGNVDMLNSVLTWIREHQGGRGCVAVSKRYAESILQKLDVMWQMRPYGVRGILNALPFNECLASQIAEHKLTVEEALRTKAMAKLDFQNANGLATGPVGEDPFSGPQLVVFLGRMTHQKGADVIAMAADYFLAKCPQCQLVFVGPICDKTGAEAEQLMGKVVHKYGSNRVLFLPKFFGGAEKKLLISATDFCLVPSRFEPCGLVDIEFGWNGAIMVGHNTGGLDKMPGIMYSVESNARAHLAAQLSQAVVKALSLTPTQRRHMFEEAMSRRFPVEDMMREYEDEWSGIHSLRAKDDAAKSESGASQHEHEAFFSTMWRKHNKKDIETNAMSKEWDRGAPLKLFNMLTGVRIGRHQISYALLLLLQSFCLLPAAMITGYATFVYLAASSIVGCESYWDKTLSYFAADPNFKYLASLAVRILLNYGVYTVLAPVWMVVAINIRPIVYIYLTVVLVLGSALLAHAAMVWTWLITPAIIACSAIAPVGLPLISLNFLGQNLEVAEVGLKYMAVTESTMNLYLFLATLLAAVSTSMMPYVVVYGFVVLLAFLVAGWFSNPDVLHPAYKRVRLVLRKQWGLITRITSFWLTTLAMIAENVALVLTAYQVLLDWDLRALLYLAAALFGARMLAVLATYVLMNLRCSQLHVQKMVLALATLPGFAIAKQLAVMYSPGLSYVILTVTLVEFFYGCRFQLVGLLAFQTLPTRELVAVWQLLTMVLSTIIPTIVLVVGYTTKPNYGREGPGLLIGVAVCEAVRFLAMGALWKVHPRENLATL